MVLRTLATGAVVRSASWTIFENLCPIRASGAPVVVRNGEHPCRCQQLEDEYV